MYERGLGVERSLKQARVWYRKAAEQGDANAQFALACSFEHFDPEQASLWMRRAAEQGHAQAQAVLGEMRLHGKGEPQDSLDALAWFAQAAQQGNSQAQFALGNLLKSDAESVADAVIHQAAIGGQAEAQYALGERYRQGIGVERNWVEACHWYLMAAQQDSALAQCALAGCYAEGKGVEKDLNQAFIWYEKAAAQNLPQALWNLGELYATGLPGVEADPKKATTLCKRAANAGFVPAQATLGGLFARAKKHDRALHWWTLAAEQGDLEALFNVGQSYRLGLGVKKDESKAFVMLLKAAQGGLAVAQSRVGLSYATGEGAALDPIEAAKWFELAALGGDAAAAANRDRAKRTLSPAQLAEAQRRVQEWRGPRENKT
jgi:TPR repeat protein